MFEADLDAVLAETRAMLLDKNKRYGDSALNPLRVFSRASAQEQIRVRMDDKLSRLARGTHDTADTEDAELDLLGYLVLLRIARGRERGVVDQPTQGSGFRESAIESPITDAKARSDCDGGELNAR